MYEAMDVANWFIWRVNLDTESGDNITNLKVQKLLYYGQGFSLAVNDRPLFETSIVAWPHGPVVVPVYETLKEYGSSPIPNNESFNPEIFDDVDHALLEDVFNVYGQFSAWGLRNLTHDESPWKNARPHQEISQDILRDYFVHNHIENA